jgi:hypothetical protein
MLRGGHVEGIGLGHSHGQTFMISRSSLFRWVPSLCLLTNTMQLFIQVESISVV